MTTETTNPKPTRYIKPPGEYVIFDIDGVLADNSHRVHHITGPGKNWGAFEEGCLEDTPIDGAIVLLHSLASRLRVNLHTGRTENARELTRQWLTLKAGAPQYEDIWMRPVDDHRPGYLLKRGWVDMLEKYGNRIVLAIDNDPATINMYVQRGIYCLEPGVTSI